MRTVLAPLAAVMMIAPALARDNTPFFARYDGRPLLARDSPQWAGAGESVRRWFQSLMQPDNPSISCCGEADAFEADTFEVEGDHYVAVVTDGKGVIADGTWIPVPNNKMKFDAGNPTGHGIIFIGSEGQVYCYVAPGGV